MGMIKIGDRILNEDNIVRICFDSDPLDETAHIELASIDTVGGGNFRLAGDAAEALRLYYYALPDQEQGLERLRFLAGQRARSRAARTDDTAEVMPF